MNYKNIKIDEISMIIELKENASEDFDINEDYVLNLLVKNKIEEPIGVENPIDDLVYLQLLFLDAENITKDSVRLLSNVYKKVKKIFPNVKISLHLDDFLEEDDNEFNEVDITLEEFLLLI